VMVDTKGPEIRTGKLQGGVDVAEIVDGSVVTLTFDDVVDDKVEETGVRLHVDYPSLAATVQVGGLVLLDDGLIALEVTGIDHASKSVATVARNSGPIKARKGVNLPGAVLDLPALTDKDKADLKWAVQEGADYVAASFIRSAANVRSCIAHLERCCDEHEVNGIRPLRPLVISKIESQEGVDNFDEILEESDGIMVARYDVRGPHHPTTPPPHHFTPPLRPTDPPPHQPSTSTSFHLTTCIVYRSIRGDLGVEIPFEKVFAAQKLMVSILSRAPSRTPSRVPSHTPSHVSSRRSSRVPSRTSSRTSSRTPSRTHSRTPRGEQMQRSRQASDRRDSDARLNDAPA
jgi:hypothetical protein